MEWFLDLIELKDLTAYSKTNKSITAHVDKKEDGMTSAKNDKTQTLKYKLSIINI